MRGAGGMNLCAGVGVFFPCASWLAMHLGLLPRMMFCTGVLAVSMRVTVDEHSFGWLGQHMARM